MIRLMSENPLRYRIVSEALSGSGPPDNNTARWRGPLQKDSRDGRAVWQDSRDGRAA
jgi:hypothetical protein